MEIDFNYVPTNGITLHTAFAGPKNGEPVILLHGFPDAWFGWQSQIPALVTAGYRVIIPDQRGYNLSEKPKGKHNYRLSILSQDILGLADNLGIEQFNLVGHDFGAMVCWVTAMYSPERLSRLVIANVPHPYVMQKYLRRNFSQIRRSWYSFFFRLPKIPEWFIRRRNWKLLISAMAKGLTEEERDRYRHAWAQENAMTSMINWYRAMKVRSSKMQPPKIKVPTLILWGKQDPYLSYEMAELSLETCTDVQLITFDEASHWVHQDEPESFNKYMIDHFEQEL